MNFYVAVYSGSGQFITMLDDVLSADASVRTNDIGSMTLSLPCCGPDGNQRTLADWPRGARIEVVINQCEACATTGEQDFLFGRQPFTVEKIERCHKDGRCTYNVQAAGANVILRRRLVAYRPKTNEAKSSNNATADAMIWRTFREALGNRAGNYQTQDGSNHDATRELAYTDGLIEFNHNPTDCAPTYSGKYANATVLSAMQQAATSAEGKGTPVFFGVTQAQPGGGQLYFDVKCGQWGTDRTSGIVVSEETQTVENACYSLDYSRATNRVYVFGGVNGDANDPANYEIVDDPSLGTILAEDPFSLIEAYASDKNFEDSNDRIDFGRTVLGQVSTRQFSGTLTDREGFRFGCQWDFGDKLPLLFADGTIQNAIVAGLHFSAQAGSVKLSADLVIGQNSGAISGIAKLAQDVKRVQNELARLKATYG